MDAVTQTWFIHTSSPVQNLESIEASKFIQSFTGPIVPIRLNFMIWKLDGGPYGSGVLTTARRRISKEVVSTCSISQRRLWHENCIYTCSQIGDTFTAELFQRKGIFVDLVNSTRIKAESLGITHIYGFPNMNSYPGYVKKLDFNEIPNLQLYQFTAILRWDYVSKQVFKVKLVLVQKLLNNKFVNILGATLIKLWRKSLWWFLRPPKNYTITQLTIAAKDLDEFWERMQSHIDTAIIRDSTYLNWRFLRNPYPYKIWVIRRNQMVVAYFVILSVPNGNFEDGERSILTDWLYDPTEGRKIQHTVLRSALKFLDSAGSSSVTAIHSRMATQELPFWRAGFIRRKLERPIIVYGSLQGKRFVSTAQNWHLTSSDLDEF
jgi:hypothetical protein